MRVPESVQVPLAVVALSALAYHLANATQAPPRQTQSQPGNQPTYFVEHPDHIQIGLPLQTRFSTLTNPYEGNPERIAEGAKLFIAYNCLDCHGAEGAGAMGPSLQDNRWHFGGTA